MFNFFKDSYDKTKVIASHKAAFMKGAALSSIAGMARTAAEVVVKTVLYTTDSLIEIALDIKNIISPKVEAEVVDVKEDNSFTGKMSSIASNASNVIAAKWEVLVAQRPGRDLSKDLAGKHPYAKLALDVASLATNLVDSVVVTTAKGAALTTADSFASGYESASLEEASEIFATESEKIMAFYADENMDPDSITAIDNIADVKVAIGDIADAIEVA